MTVYLIEHHGEGVATYGNASSDRHAYATGRVAPNFPMPSIYCLSLVSRKVDPRNIALVWLDMLLSNPAYHTGELPANFPMPAIAQCYCGHSIENHRDRIPCDYLGFFNYG